jgi:hypothetical protein
VVMPSTGSGRKRWAHLHPKAKGRLWLNPAVAHYLAQFCLECKAELVGFSTVLQEPCSGRFHAR